MRQPFKCIQEAIPISNYITEQNTKARQNTKRKQQRILVFFCLAAAIILMVLILILLLPKGDVTPEIQEPIETETAPPSLPTEPPATEPVISASATIAGIPVEGRTRQQALDALRTALGEYPADASVELSAAGETLAITAEQAKVGRNFEKAVDAALGGTSGEIDLELTMDAESVMNALTPFFASLGGVYSPSGYWLEGEAPQQTLVINTGTPGYPVDLVDVYGQLYSAFALQLSQISLDTLGALKEPMPLDIKQICKQVSLPAQNPRVDPKTLEIIPGKPGYGFDPESAASLLESAQPGQTLRIPMVTLQPADESEAWFQDTLGYYKTEYTDNENRNENLRLACSKLDGRILQPGEVLSYNEALGKRTREAGYKPAPAYSGTELVDEVGGGICQVSSTLYLSSLFAELTVVERKNHGFPAGYIPLGLDATVNWGTTDLKLRNDYDLPVKILAEATDGYVRIRIMGVERRDYYVKMEYRVDDHPSYAAAFRCRYDRETDEQISRVLDHTSVYLEDVWCNPGFAQSSVDEP